MAWFEPFRLRFSSNFFFQIALCKNLHLTELDPSKHDSIVVNGQQLRELTDSELDRILLFREIVFARTSPQQKLIIVEGVQVK